jgi:hypothetical protein
MENRSEVIREQLPKKAVTKNIFGCQSLSKSNAVSCSGCSNNSPNENDKIRAQYNAVSVNLFEIISHIISGPSGPRCSAKNENRALRMA